MSKLQKCIAVDENISDKNGYITRQISSLEGEFPGFKGGTYSSISPGYYAFYYEDITEILTDLLSYIKNEKENNYEN
jgi:hypothetical protein